MASRKPLVLVNGTMQQLSGADSLDASVTTNAVRENFTQPGHGLSPGDAVKGSTGSFSKALADSAANAAVVGVVDYAPPDQYCQLLLHCDGPANSTAFPDESGRTMTAVGTAKITAGSCFGTGAAILDGTSGISTPTDANTRVGTSDFVIDCRLYLDEIVGGYTALLDTGWTSGITFYYTLSGGPVGQLFLRIGAGGAGYVCVQLAEPLSATTWHHVAVVRSAGEIYFYVDGTRVAASQPLARDNNAQDALLYVGYGSAFSGVIGKLDEFRFSVGTDRGWTGSTITVPTAAYAAGNDFAICYSGRALSIGGLTAGEQYLSPSVPGLLTATRPGSGIVRHIASVGNSADTIVQIYGEVP